MKKQYYYCIHAEADQTQVKNEDRELREFLNCLGVSRAAALLDQISKSYMEHHSQKTAIFYSFKYNEYTNLSKLEAGRRLAVHGIKGIHDLKRSTPYVSIFVADESELLGTDFFDYVFGMEYPSEQQLRMGSKEKISEMLENAASIPGKNKQSFHVESKDQMLVCKIIEHLWSAQIADSSSRLVILLPEDDIYERSMDLLRQIYLLLPQKIRMNMGFAVDSTFEDIRKLTERGSMNQYCDLPIHIFTMRYDSEQVLEQIRIKENVKYPIVYFDAVNPERELCDESKLQLLLELSEKMSSTTDAKMAYAEKVVLNDGHRQVSFKNLEEVFSKINGQDFFWWCRKNLETPEELINAYYDQKELMQNEELRKEAILSFYTQMLPWKNYVIHLNNILMDEDYPKRKKILDFFRDELYFASILDAAQNMKEQLDQKAVEHEQLLLEAEKTEFEKQTDQLIESHKRELILQENCLKEEKQQNLKLKQEIDALEEEFNQETVRQRRAHQEEIQREQQKYEQALKMTELQREQYEQTIEDLEEQHYQELTKQKEDTLRKMQESEEQLQRILNEESEKNKKDMEVREEEWNRRLKDIQNSRTNDLLYFQEEKGRLEDNIRKLKKFSDENEKEYHSLLNDFSNAQLKSTELQKEIQDLRKQYRESRVYELEKQKCEVTRSAHNLKKLCYIAWGISVIFLISIVCLGTRVVSKNKLFKQSQESMVAMRLNIQTQEAEISNLREQLMEEKAKEQMRASDSNAKRQENLQEASKSTVSLENEDMEHAED